MRDDVEISFALDQELASWRRVFVQRNGSDPRQLLRQASTEIWRTLEVDRTANPDAHIVAHQVAVDALADMAEIGGIAADDAQQIFAECFAPGADGKAKLYAEAPPQTSENARSRLDPPPQWLDLSEWDNQPLPQRKWAIKDRVPLNQAGLFSGEGGAGKSIIELMKDVAHVAGKDWLGSLPEPGPAFYLGAEDDKDELHIRLAAIAKHYQTTFAGLAEGGLHVLCLLGQDATLCAANPRTGKVETTALYRQIYEAAGDIKPKNISIDTLSRAFAGSEIDRAQVYAFAMHMQALAMVANGSVTVLSHPILKRFISLRVPATAEGADCSV